MLPHAHGMWLDVRFKLVGRFVAGSNAIVRASRCVCHARGVFRLFGNILRPAAGAG